MPKQPKQERLLLKILSQIFTAIQGYLFPYIEGEWGTLTQKHKQVIQTLELIPLAEFVKASHKVRGRQQADRGKLARAFVVKAVYNLSTPRQLIDWVEGCPVLRRICGWEKSREIPHESTFSRTFEEFALSRLPQRVHEALVREHQGEEIKGHLRRDRTAIEVREKPGAKGEKAKEEKPKRQRGRPKKGEEVPLPEPTRLERQLTLTREEMQEDLPQGCDRGCKKNSQGYTQTWTGFKLHLDCVDGPIPVSALLSSASLHDSQAALPLAEMSAQRVTNLYDLMDAAYDAEIIREPSRALGHVPIIDANPRRGAKAEMDPPEKERYKERSSVERVFSRLKDEFGASHVRVRGLAKVMAHLMFGVLALTADQLFRLVP